MEHFADLLPRHVAAVIVNYNGRLDTAACLAGLCAATDAPGWIVVVDNNSSDNSVEYIAAAWEECAGAPPAVIPSSAVFLEAAPSLPRSVLIAHRENAGYGAGNNIGLAALLRVPECGAFWILNNDVLIRPGALAALCAKASSGSGIVGSTLVQADSPDRIQCLGGASYNIFLGYTRQMRNGLALKDALPIAEGRVDAALDFISGASLLVKRAVLERIGLFSEEYFLYYEDVDFCLRAKKAGFSLAWAKASVLVHKEGGTTGAGRETRPPWADYLGIRNRIFFTGKHYPRLLPVVIAGLAGVCLRRILRRQPERLKIVFAALLDGLWARMGRSERLKALFPAAGGKG